METTILPLTRGKVTSIDVEDLPNLNNLKWQAHFTRGLWYAVHSIQSKGISKKIWLHRFILQAPKGIEVDHINGDGLDNRRANLRLCSHAQNARNLSKVARQTTSQFKGVSFFKPGEKYRARIYFEGQIYYLGNYQTEEEAADAYNKKAKELFGEFARFNAL